MDRSLTDIVLKQMQINNDAERELHNPCKIYPSSIGDCTRKIIYRMSGYVGKKMDGRSLLIMSNGTYFHERMEKIFEDSGILIAKELNVTIPDKRLGGRTDSIIRNTLSEITSDKLIELKDSEGNVIYSGPQDGAIVVELKSISASGFDYVGSKGPKKGHIMQLQLYMDLLGVHQGILFYENKNNQEIKEFRVKYDPTIAQEIREKVDQINKHVDENTIPDKEYQRSDFECIYCDYRDLCWPVQGKYTLDSI